MSDTPTPAVQPPAAPEPTPEQKRELMGRQIAPITHQSLADATAMGALLSGLRKEFNLVSPLSRIEFLPALMQVSMRAVPPPDTEVDRFGNGRDTYCSKAFMSPNERALSAGYIRQIMAAAGVDYSVDPVVMQDAGRWTVTYRATGAVMDVDGTVRRAECSKTVSFEDPEVWPEGPAPNDRKGRTAAQKLRDDLSRNRETMHAVCETKAIMRMVRQLLGLKHKYTVDELRKPFLFPKLVSDLDMDDPAQKQAAIDRALGTQSLLHGTRSTAPAAAIDVTPVAVPAQGRSPELVDGVRDDDGAVEPELDHEPKPGEAAAPTAAEQAGATAAEVLG